jgi:hypothetical protein
MGMGFSCRMLLLQQILVALLDLLDGNCKIVGDGFGERRIVRIESDTEQERSMSNPPRSIHGERASRTGGCRATPMREAIQRSVLPMLGSQCGCATPASIYVRTRRQRQTFRPSRWSASASGLWVMTLSREFIVRAPDRALHREQAMRPRRCRWLAL